MIFLLQNRVEIETEPYYGEVKELKGVWVTGRTLEDCRNSLREVIEGWIVVSINWMH